MDHSFVVVHNGIITNYKDVKNYLESKGHTFESDTDTEIIAKLVYHLYRKHPNYSFRELVEQVIQQLVSAILINNFFSLRAYIMCISIKLDDLLIDSNAHSILFFLEFFFHFDINKQNQLKLL